VELNEKASEEMRTRYLERKEEQEAIMIQQAEKNLKIYEEEQSKKADNGGMVEGPLQLGSNIPDKEEPRQMISITEEERSVIVQGHVFDSEVRELRSGRKLLIFKVTDYSSSFSVKIFSNNEKDEANFEKVKKGIWVRVRGSVQE